MLKINSNGAQRDEKLSVVNIESNEMMHYNTLG